MATDRHMGRQSPAFPIEGRPDTFIGLIQRHGVLARIVRSRKCPCVMPNGSPDMFCTLCHGDGLIYDFQRRLFQADEDSDISADGRVVYPFRIPVMEPLTVDRLLPEEQGGITRYAIEGFTPTSITISGDPAPLPYEKMRVSYIFDRWERLNDERPVVDAATKTLEVLGTKYDDGYRSSNFQGVHGDIAHVIRVYDEERGHEFRSFTYTKNYIYLGDDEPAPTPGKVVADLYYVPVAKVIPNDVESRQGKEEKWTSDIPQGNCRIAIEPWFEVGEGDLITFLTPTIYRSEILTHSATGIDKLFEFDISQVDECIFDARGTRYYRGKDFHLRNFRDLSWTGSQPPPGEKIVVRYGYHPTYVVFIDNPQPNNLENKQFPQFINAKLWAKTRHQDNAVVNTWFFNGN